MTTVLMTRCRVADFDAWGRDSTPLLLRRPRSCPRSRSHRGNGGRPSTPGDGARCCVAAASGGDLSPCFFRGYAGADEQAGSNNRRATDAGAAVDADLTALGDLCVEIGQQSGEVFEVGRHAAIGDGEVHEAEASVFGGFRLALQSNVLGLIRFEHGDDGVDAGVAERTHLVFEPFIAPRARDDGGTWKG